MRTEKPPSAAATLARLRSQLVRVKRSFLARGPALRWSMALGAPAVLVLIGYLVTPVPAGSEYLHGGRKFANGDLIKIRRALDVQQVAYRVDDQGRVEIASNRRDDAKAALAKIEVGPRSFDEITNRASEPHLLELPGDREMRQIKGREEILAAMIRNLDGIVYAYVKLNQPKAWGGHKLGAGPGTRPTAFVYLETENGREKIRYKTVQSIQNIIVGSEPGLKHDAVTVMDNRGNHYLKADDPTSSTSSETKAREEDLGEEILEQIDWIRGVRVTVQLVSTPAPASVPMRVQDPPVAPTTGPGREAPARAHESPGSSVAANAPLELEPDPGPGPVPAVAASSLPEPPAAKTETARVWVRVPRSYYYSKATPERDPSPDRLQPIIARTESLILAAVEHVIPPELAPPGAGPEVKIDTIPDDVPVDRPLESPVAGDARRPSSWWFPAGVVGGGLIVLLSAVGLRILASRRPAVRPRRLAATRPGRYRSDPAASPGPGPAERVRELIRRNPEAAAGVLHRWIGQEESQE